MSFCKFSTELVSNNKTWLDNIFITDYLCDAPEYCLKVYLYGLYLCNNPGEEVFNTINSFTSKLNMNEQDVESAFLYWQERGLVQVINVSPIEVRYLPVSYGTKANLKLDENKYSNFIACVVELINGRDITKTELYEYCDTMERYHIEQNAMLNIIKFCIDTKKSNVSYRYIINVAHTWANEGYNTEQKILEKLQNYNQTSQSFEDFNKFAGIRTQKSVENLDTFNKWINIGFNLDTLFHIANYYKKLKNKLSYDKLDTFIMKCYEMHLMDNKEIDDYLEQKENMLCQAKTICKNLGVYYENLEPVVDNYISKWQNLGYDANILEVLSNYCFKNSIRTLEQMNNLIQKFYKLGITNQDGLNEYLSNALAEEEQIKKLITSLGLVRNVNNNDRACYKTWTTEWNTPDELINYASSLSCNKANPIQYMNKVLSLYKSQNVQTLEQAKCFDLPKLLYAQNNVKKDDNRQYSKEQLSKMFVNLEEIDI